MAQPPFLCRFLLVPCQYLHITTHAHCLPEMAFRAGPQAPIKLHRVFLFPMIHAASDNISISTGKATFQSQMPVSMFKREQTDHLGCHVEQWESRLKLLVLLLNSQRLSGGGSAQAPTSEGLSCNCPSWREATTCAAAPFPGE